MALDQNLEMAVNAALFTKPNIICNDATNPNSLQNNSINLFFDACDPDHRFPTFYVHEEVASRLGQTKIESSGFNIPTTSVDHYNDSGQTIMEDIGYYVTKRADDNAIIVLVVNRTEYAPLIDPDVYPHTIAIDPGMEYSSANMYSLVGTTYNGNAFSIEEQSTEDLTTPLDLSAVTFPYASVSFIEIIPCESPCEGEVEVVGNIATEVGSNVAQVEVLGCNVTGDDGNYSCSGTTPGSNGEIIPIKDINPENGLDANDIFLIEQHILGLQLLDSPYKVIAADANGNGTITGLDLVTIRSIILGISNSFPNDVDSWRFVPSDYTFPVPFYWPNQADFPESVILDQVTECETHDFVGIKIGDVNISANPLLRITPSPEEALSIQLTDQPIKAGEVIKVPLRVKGFNTRTAYQFFMDINPDYLEVLDWEAGDIEGFEKDNVAYINDQVRAVWWSRSAQKSLTFDDQSNLFTLVLRAKQNSNSIAHLFQLRNDGKDSKIFDASGFPYPINLETLKPDLGEDKIIAYPNPFKNETTISFLSSATTEGVLNIYNTNGELLKTHPLSLVQGKNNFTLNEAQLPNGVLFFTIETEINSYQGKLIKLK